MSRPAGPPGPTGPPPPGPDAVAVALTPATPRRYDLDALRAVAMGLGIVLHAALPFVPYWAEGDTGGAALFAVFEYIHLWRMPLFFLLSGFFTAMLWKRRGLGALLRHRLRRIALPLAVLYVPVMVLVIAGIVAGYGIAGEKVQDASGRTDAYEEPGTDAEPTDDENGAPEGSAFGFAHLWFLWHLLWLIAVFGVVAWLLDTVHTKVGRDPPEQITRAFTWSLPLVSLVPFSQMHEDILGPDTSDGLVPAWPVIGFYATFFFFGATCYRSKQLDAPIDRLGQWWVLQLVASGALFAALFGQLVPDGFRKPSEVLLAWMVSFAAIGLARRHLHAPSYRVRWLSDSAYWMYLMHLPLVFVFQGVAVALGLPPLAGFVFIIAATVAVLVPSYQKLVRYTWIGRLLNDRRTRADDLRLQESIRLSRPDS